jgi:prepilin-type processing-associated H-X9-DG protein
MYTEEHRGFVPRPKVLSDPQVGGNHHTHWHSANYVGQYIGNRNRWEGDSITPSNVLFCPLVKSRNPDANGIGLNFLSNCRLFHDKPLSANDPIPLTKVRSSSARFIVLVDTLGNSQKPSTGHHNWGSLSHIVDGVGYRKSGDNPAAADLAVGNTYGTNAYRHSDRCNLAFADGHTSNSSDVPAAELANEFTHLANKQ